jgi:3-deoxy-manno-octulosonate cytidylyltransferase (CMP-KDO synthetase)
MTADTHERCTDRIAEAARNLELDADVVVNVQGDEPLFHPGQIEELLAPYREEPELPCTNLMAEISEVSEFESADVVKTVCAPDGNALYFSREPIPSRSHSKVMFKKYKQLGVISFKRDYLQAFTALPPTPLEEIESVDMLRAVEHGHRVRMAATVYPSIGVDTPEGLDKAARLMADDALFPTYRNG